MKLEKVLKGIITTLLSVAFYIFMVAVLNAFNLGVEFESFINMLKVLLIPVCIFVGYVITIILFHRND